MNVEITFITILASFLVWKLINKNRTYYDDPLLNEILKKIQEGHKVELSLEDLANVLSLSKKDPVFSERQKKLLQKKDEKSSFIKSNQSEKTECMEIKPTVTFNIEKVKIKDDSQSQAENSEIEKQFQDSKEKISQDNFVVSEMEEYLLEAPDPLPLFLKENVLPLKEKFVKEGIYESILKILFLLADAEDKSSIVSVSDRNLSIGYSILKNVSLLEHSINTAIIGIELTKKEIPYAFDLIPGKYFLIFLAHDIGKSYLKESYATGDHPILSARILAEIIPEEYPHKINILSVIEKHHQENIKYPPSSSEEYDIYLLQAADRLAREKEISQADVQKIVSESSALSSSQILEDKTDDFTYISPKGISAVELLEKIKPLINKSLTGEDFNNPELPIPPEAPEGSFVAVSQPDGLVFVRPDVFYEAFLSIVKEKGLERENASLIVGGKNNTLKHLIAWLLEEDIVPSGHVKKGYFGRWYSFKIGNSEFKSLFTPIKATAFGCMPSDFERVRRENPRVAKIHSFRKASSGK